MVTDINAPSDLAVPRTDSQPDATATRDWPFSITIVIPALNEGASITGVVERTRAVCPDAEVLVVDDASSARGRAAPPPTSAASTTRRATTPRRAPRPRGRG